jgi:hypothetical protein
MSRSARPTAARWSIMNNNNVSNELAMHSGPRKRQQMILAWLALAICAGGCGKDFKSIGDQHVQKDFLEKHPKQEALPFFANQGKYCDLDNSTHVDSEIVVPLLQRLHAIAATEQWVMLRPNRKNTAYALLVKLPSDRHIEDQMADAVQEADDRFPGLILQQWGHEWLLMDLIDQKTYEILKKSRPNIDHQRDK